MVGPHRRAPFAVQAGAQPVSLPLVPLFEIVAALLQRRERCCVTQHHRPRHCSRRRSNTGRVHALKIGRLSVVPIPGGREGIGTEVQTPLPDRGDRGEEGPDLLGSVGGTVNPALSLHIQHRVRGSTNCA